MLKVDKTPTVMVVDDDSGVRDALTTLLDTFGYGCRCFASGNAFLNDLLPEAPCCVLLDLELRGQSGLEVQSKLKTRGSTLPVIFISGNHDAADVACAMQAGAIDFLQKPCDTDWLITRIEEALQASVTRPIRN